MIIHQRVQRVKLHHPQEVLPRPIPQNLKVLHVVPEPEREGVREKRDREGERERREKERPRKRWGERERENTFGIKME